MGRLYLAILVGTLLEETRVNAPLSDQVAITTFRPQEQRGPCCLVEAALSTGRTHQVRRHAESLLAPVAGDSKYGRLIQRRVGLRPPRLALHASSLCFVDPLTKQPLSFAAALPPDLSTWWDGLKAPA
jgi:23S rRNA-/tRNA-specific pseudouridylate synthase